MTYVLEVLTEMGTECPYSGSDHRKALAAAKNAWNDRDTLDIKLSCLAFHEDCSFDLRLTDKGVTPIIEVSSNGFIKINEEALPF